METLLITDLEETTVESLRRIAVENGHALEQEAASLIRQGIARTPGLSRRERADAIAAMTPKGVVQTDSTLLVRDDRDHGH